MGPQLDVGTIVSRPEPAGAGTTACSQSTWVLGFRHETCTRAVGRQRRRMRPRSICDGLQQRDSGWGCTAALRQRGMLYRPPPDACSLCLQPAFLPKCAGEDSARRSPWHFFGFLHAVPLDIPLTYRRASETPRKPKKTYPGRKRRSERAGNDHMRPSRVCRPCSSKPLRAARACARDAVTLVTLLCEDWGRGIEEAPGGALLPARRAGSPPKPQMHVWMDFFGGTPVH